MNIERMNELLGLLYRIEGIEHGAEKKFSALELIEIYEGNDRWPDFARNTIEKAGDLFEPACLILDADFHESNGNIHKLHEVTERFKKNLKAIFDYMCPKFSLRMFSPSYRKYRKNAKIAMNVLCIVVSDGYVKRRWEEAKRSF